MSEHHHDHHVQDEQRLRWALLLTGSFMVAELAGGLVSGSLALVADAGHMLTDSASLFLAWIAARLAQRPPDDLRSYGWQRFQIVAALINAVALLFLVGWIAYEAIERLFRPQPVLGGIMMGVAVLGLLVNLLVFRLLHAGSEDNLNVRAALLHVLGDLLGSVAAIVASVVILLTGWTPIDPILSLLVVLLILNSTWRILKHSIHILMEGAPSGIDLDGLRRTLVGEVPGVRDVHHVHLWSLTPDRPLITLHLRLEEGQDGQQVLERAKRLLRERFGLDHSTIQVEWAPCIDDNDGT
ncbi:MAG: cation diffusion facilitator family transporter [Gammaproteobacteria bacterium]|nr:MAG: cation diffusion facilitator family transporter [Gammaproteobacteria bacterium]